MCSDCRFDPCRRRSDDSFLFLQYLRDFCSEDRRAYWYHCFFFFFPRRDYVWSSCLYFGDVFWLFHVILQSLFTCYRVRTIRSPWSCDFRYVKAWISDPWDDAPSPNCRRLFLPIWTLSIFICPSRFCPRYFHQESETYLTFISICCFDEWQRHDPQEVAIVCLRTLVVDDVSRVRHVTIQVQDVLLSCRQNLKDVRSEGNELRSTSIRTGQDSCVRRKIFSWRRTITYVVKMSSDLSTSNTTYIPHPMNLSLHQGSA